MKCGMQVVSESCCYETGSEGASHNQQIRSEGTLKITLPQSELNEGKKFFYLCSLSCCTDKTAAHVILYFQFILYYCKYLNGGSWLYLRFLVVTQSLGEELMVYLIDS